MIKTVYFSPAGTTKKVTEYVAEKLEQKLTKEHFDTITVVGMPVFAGRIPSVMAEKLAEHSGAGQKAVALVVYGNRDYEDALLELSDILSDRGFQVVGAAAVVAQHSIFPQVAAGRPDLEDLDKLDRFAGDCAQKIMTMDVAENAQDVQKTQETIFIKGNRPYRQPTRLPFCPSADERCDGCGVCITLCPVQAIQGETVKTANPELCINCTACIYGCPKQARGFWQPEFKDTQKLFEAKCAQRREPECFL